jgi:hypothetical protein
MHIIRIYIQNYLYSYPKNIRISIHIRKIKMSMNMILATIRPFRIGLQPKLSASLLHACMLICCYIGISWKFCNAFTTLTSDYWVPIAANVVCLNAWSVSFFASSLGKEPISFGLGRLNTSSSFPFLFYFPTKLSSSLGRFIQYERIKVKLYFLNIIYFISFNDF